MVLTMCKYTVVSCIENRDDKSFTDKQEAIDYAKQEIARSQGYQRYVVFFGQPNANASVRDRQVVLEIKARDGQIL
jgi:hypothetical protein